MSENLKVGAHRRRAVTAALTAVLSMVLVVGLGSPPASANPPISKGPAQQFYFDGSDDLATVIAAAENLASNPSASPAAVTAALNNADAAATSPAQKQLQTASGMMSPFTNNANGSACSWKGYCDFRLSNTRALTLANTILSNPKNAGLICARAGVFTAYCAIAYLVLVGQAYWIRYLVNHWHRGIFIRLFHLPGIWGSSYIWHQ